MHKAFIKSLYWIKQIIIIEYIELSITKYSVESYGYK